MKRSVLVIVAVAVAFAWAPMPASAATTAQANGAVRKEIRSQLDLGSPRVSCRRLTQRRWTCRWTALSYIDEPVCSGTARATRYRYGWSVRLRNSSGDSLCYPG